MIVSGLPDYATSTPFQQEMQTANVPHPFHSHPPLPERMQRAGYQLDEAQYGAVVTQTPARTWVEDMPGAEEIEQRLWAAYEQRFARSHERVLAYTYEPSTEEETAIVLKFFPPVLFPLKGEQGIEVTYAGLQVPEHAERIPWDNVIGLQYNDSLGGDSLLISLTEKALLGNKTIKVRLPGIGKEKEKLKAVLGLYWRRHKSMRRGQATTAG